MPKEDDKKPASGEAFKTTGEASARAYMEAKVPEAADGPTIELDRVRLARPSQTPTVRFADLAKRPGPRAPEQRVKPAPKGQVELPEGRPVTEAQVIEIDPDVLLDLVKRKVQQDDLRRAEVGAQRADSPWVNEAGAVSVAAAELPSVEGPPAEMVSEPVKRRRRSGMVMAVAIGVTVVVGMIAAMRAGRAPAPGATVTPSATVTAVPSATAVPNATAIVRPSASTAPTPSPVTSAVATPSVAPAVIKPMGKPASTSEDPYDAMPPKTATPAAPLAPVPSPDRPAAPALPGGDKSEF